MIEKFRWAFLPLLFFAGNLFAGVGVSRYVADVDYYFSHPSEWIVIPVLGESQCISFVQKKNARKSDLNGVRICKKILGFEKSLLQSVFKMENGKWLASGSMDEQKAKKTKGPRGVEIVETMTPPSCGVVDRNGVFRAAGGQCYSALIGNSKISVSIESTGASKDYSSMRKITGSVVFRR